MQLVLLGSPLNRYVTVDAEMETEEGDIVDLEEEMEGEDEDDTDGEAEDEHDEAWAAKTKKGTTPLSLKQVVGMLTYSDV